MMLSSNQIHLRSDIVKIKSLLLILLHKVEHRYRHGDQIMIQLRGELKTKKPAKLKAIIIAQNNFMNSNKQITIITSGVRTSPIIKRPHDDNNDFADDHDMEDDDSAEFDSSVKRLKYN